ncbi:MAG: glycosyl transferase family 36 [Calditrichaeota bacterium]|nr:glycosyl transferase family 36 [Calditrichota bacterium]
MRYGQFSPDGKEFVIDNVATPTPWINYIYNDRYFSTISNNGGGISYVQNPLHGRITRYRINDVPPDRPGKYVYIKDEETGDFWSATWQPVGKNQKAYQAVHGFGYTRVSAEINGIFSEITYFVPVAQTQEIWHLVLTNRSNRPRSLSLFGYVEFCLGHALVDLINQADDQHFNRVVFDSRLNALFATKTYWITEGLSTQQQENKAWDQWAFFTVNHPVSAYETRRERFLGAYRNENAPEAVETGRLSSQDSDFGNAVGALKIDLTLPPGGRIPVLFRLGVIPKERFESDKQAAVQAFRTPEDAATALQAVTEKWERFFQHVRVNTPDADTNIFLNYWTPYQAKVAFDVGRVASFYYWGISRGFGFRDMAQDILAITISDVQKARERILLLARQMFRNGRVYHHFYRDGQGELTRHCDDSLWFILAVTEYIQETGDKALLQEEEPFADGGKGTLWDHLKAVVRYAEDNLGPHHLPIFGRGDWNDTLDYIGGEDEGESVWGGMFYVAMLNRLGELAHFVGETAFTREVERLRDRIQQNLNTVCWDGKWFIRAFGADGKKIGSKENRAGRIFLNTQSWAVIASVSEPEKLRQAMDSVRIHLDTDFGPKLCAPAFREIDPNIGLITRCVPGKKENGAVFCHATTWAILAECLLKRGDQAFAYYKKLLPNAVDSDQFRVEPYVYSQYITSNEHPTAGMASHSWQTGTAAWMYRVAIDYMLGVRPTYWGLRVDPVIPSDWQEFSVERVFRGARYRIRVHNPGGVESRVTRIQMDGQPVEGPVLPICSKAVCQVEVWLGQMRLE